jgi:hypothetical protein
MSKRKKVADFVVELTPAQPPYTPAQVEAARAFVDALVDLIVAEVLNAPKARKRKGKAKR